MNITAVVTFAEAAAQAMSIEEVIKLRFHPKGISKKGNTKIYLARLMAVTITEAIAATSFAGRCFQEKLGVPGVDGLIEMKKTLLVISGVDAQLPEFEPPSEEAKDRLFGALNAALQEVLDRQPK